MDVVGHLASVAADGKIDQGVLDCLSASLEDESMVTAAHGVDNLSRIALAKPGLRSLALAELFRVESIPRAADCREVLLGKVADGLGRLLPHLSRANGAEALRFLERLAASDGRPGIKAGKILRRLRRNS